MKFLLIILPLIKQTVRTTEKLRLKMMSEDLLQHPCSEQDLLTQVAQDCVHSGFEYLQGWTLYHLSGQPPPAAINHHHNKVVGFFFLCLN